MALDIEREAQQAITLIKSFNLELEEYGPESQVLYWLNKYRALWIRDAIIEAVYQGRYKVISVEHILTIWQRRGQPVRHFTSGFEQVIAAQLGTSLRLSTTMMSPLAAPAGAPMDTATSSSPPIYNGLDIGDRPSPRLSSNSDHAGSSIEAFSIEAFPAAAFDTLVEVYQAGTDSTAYKTVNQLDTSSSLDDLGLDIPNFDREAPIRHMQRAYPTASEPIQPFRPIPRRRQPQV